jgi:hypothetical protein
MSTSKKMEFLVLQTNKRLIPDGIKIFPNPKEIV